MSDWQPIETAPDLERVMVCGWNKQTQTCKGYWWWHEDVCDNGIAIEHHHALYWTKMVLPAFPEPPQ
jgi:hypothetical protein